LDAPWFIPLLPAHDVSPRLPSREFAWHRLRNMIRSCGRCGSIISAKHFPGFGLACCDIRSKTHLPENAFWNSGSRSGDSLGVIAALLPSLFWPASLPHGRLIGIWLSSLSALGICTEIWRKRKLCGSGRRFPGGSPFRRIFPQNRGKSSFERALSARAKQPKSRPSRNAPCCRKKSLLLSRNPATGHRDNSSSRLAMTLTQFS